MLRTAPIAFLSLAGLSLVAGFGAGVFFKDQQVAAMEALMRLKDGELDEKASPMRAGARARGVLGSVGVLSPRR